MKTNRKQKQRLAREYMGAVIFPAGINGSGIRWTSNVGTGLTLKSDTLAGIKELIRKSLR